MNEYNWIDILRLICISILLTFMGAAIIKENKIDTNKIIEEIRITQNMIEDCNAFKIKGEIK